MKRDNVNAVEKQQTPMPFAAYLATAVKDKPKGKNKIYVTGGPTADDVNRMGMTTWTDDR